MHEIITFKEALAYAKDLDVKLIPYEMAEGMARTRELIGAIKPGQTVGFIIGPEGGIDDDELEAAIASGFESITLGKRILRTETAGLTVLSILMYNLESE